MAKFKRILLKLSGEVLAGGKGHGFDFETINSICKSVSELAKLGVEVGLVVGGGNFWRGRSGGNMDRTRADHMGMLATVINSLALQDALEQIGVPTRVQTAIEMRQIAEPYIRRRAVRHLEKERVVIFAAGTGNPYFSTDTTAALRAAEIEADAILMAKNVDAIYSADPAKDPNAVKYTQNGSVGLYVRGIRDNSELIMHMSVEDTGMGIKPEDMEDLFESFKRLEEKKISNEKWENNDQ